MSEFSRVACILKRLPWHTNFERVSHILLEVGYLSEIAQTVFSDSSLLNRSSIHVNALSIKIFQLHIIVRGKSVHHPKYFDS